MKLKVFDLLKFG